MPYCCPRPFGGGNGRVGLCLFVCFARVVYDVSTFVCVGYAGRRRRLPKEERVSKRDEYSYTPAYGDA